VPEHSLSTRLLDLDGHGLGIVFCVLLSGNWGISSLRVCLPIEALVVSHLKVKADLLYLFHDLMKRFEHFAVYNCDDSRG